MTTSRLVRHSHKVYVGSYLAVGQKDHLGNGQVAPSPYASPDTFYATANNVQGDVYSNNMDFVRYYKPENVICVFETPDGRFLQKSLIEHPKFNNWEEEMDSGEMVALFGWYWVLVESENEDDN